MAHPIQVVKSLESLYFDGALMPGGERVFFAVCEIRGDWKWQQDTGNIDIGQNVSLFFLWWPQLVMILEIKLISVNICKYGQHQEWLQLSCNYLCNMICHNCRATKPSYVSAPSKLATEFRHDTPSFLAECCKHGDLFRHFVVIKTWQGCCCFLSSNIGLVWWVLETNQQYKVPCYHCHRLECKWFDGMECMWTTLALICGYVDQWSKSFWTMTTYLEVWTWMNRIGSCLPMTCLKHGAEPIRSGILTLW